MAKIQIKFRHYTIYSYTLHQVTSPGWASILLSLFCLLFLPTFKDIKKKVPSEFLADTYPILEEHTAPEDIFGGDNSHLLTDVVSNSSSHQEGVTLKEGDMDHSTITANPLPSASGKNPLFSHIYARLCCCVSAPPPSPTRCCDPLRLREPRCHATASTSHWMLTLDLPTLQLGHSTRCGSWPIPSRVSLSPVSSCVSISSSYFIPPSLYLKQLVMFS